MTDRRYPDQPVIAKACEFMWRLALALPIGAWHPLFPAMLRSLAVQPRSALQLAVLDASGDPRVTAALDASGLEFDYRRHGSDAGQAAAIQEGWDALDAPWLGWLNADDVLTPDAVKHWRKAAQADPAADVIHGDSLIISGDGQVVGAHGQVMEAGPTLLRSNTISQPSCIVQRTAVEAVGGIDRSLHYVMDWDLWVRLYVDGARFHMIQRFLSCVYWGEGTKTSRLNVARLGEFLRLVLRHCGSSVAVRSVLGLTMQNRSALLARPFRRGPPQALAGLRLAANAHPHERPVRSVELPLINFGDEPAARAHIWFETGAAHVTADIGARAEPIVRTSWRITSHRPVPPGQSITVLLSCDQGTDRLLRAGFICPET